jgi:NAD(P)H-dependent flavin oxidoreductase YrpB (nitropropane dioxygenase family)
MSAPLHTRLCDLLGIRFPILCAPMGWLTGPELVAAVCNAGGLGILGAGSLPPEELRARIRRVRELTSQPFGVNLILSRPSEERARVCFEERVALLSLFWGDPQPYVAGATELGIKTCIQVGSVASAQQAARTGVDFVIAQGMEAGGHTHGQVTTMTLVPQVVDAVRNLPVVAAGGIADARGLVAALALGAQGAALGTRFLASEEAQAHPRYKELVVAAGSEDTVRTTLYGGGWPNAPHRVLHTAFVAEWLPQEARGSEGRPDEPIVGRSVLAGETVAMRRFMVLPPNVDTSGEIEAMALYAGQSAGLLNNVQPAGRIVERLVAESIQLLQTTLCPLAR